MYALLSLIARVLSGDHCEVELPCATNPCLNSGDCLNLNETGPSSSLPDVLAPPGFACVCNGPYTGARCEAEADPCLSSPCANDGQCLTERGDASQSFFCQCVEGFIGELCTIELPHPCEDLALEPCLNGADCVSTIGRDYVCNCTDGYQGQRCEDGPCQTSSHPCR